MESMEVLVSKLSVEQQIELYRILHECLFQIDNRRTAEDLLSEEQLWGDQFAKSACHFPLTETSEFAGNTL